MSEMLQWYSVRLWSYSNGLRNANKALRKEPPWKIYKRGPPPLIQDTPFWIEEDFKQVVVHLDEKGECEVRALVKGKPKEQCLVLSTLLHFCMPPQRNGISSE